MPLYAIGDLHLSFSEKVDKPMDIFGENWANHTERIKQNWRASDDDLTVLAGDISWAMNFSELLPDFAFIESLPGKKIILKGNHDYWWETMKKMNKFAENYPSISFLHNNSYVYEGVSICGTRGWIAEPDEKHDETVLAREVGRLRLSLQSAKTSEKIVFLHYPPITEYSQCVEILSVLKEFSIKQCFFGHLHGKAIKGAFVGEKDGTYFDLISADYLNFIPAKIILPLT